MTTLTDIRTLVRRDLKDEDSGDYRWTDDEIDRAIQKAVLEYSGYCPLPQLTALATVDQDDQVDISTLTDRIDILKVEHPVTDKPYPPRRFAVWADVLYFLDGYLGDGGDCNIHWLKKHSLDTASTIPAPHEGVIALGACAFAVSSLGQYHANLANIGGKDVDRDYNLWAKQMFTQFYAGLERIRWQSPASPAYQPKRLKLSSLTPEE